jgi:hypothetical protein
MSGSLYVGGLPSGEVDADLDSLLTDLDLSVSRTTVRRNGGVEEEKNRNQRDNAAFQTPGSWPGARQGTSGSVSETMYGQAETVMSDTVSARVPRSVSMRTSVGSTVKKFKLFRVPRVDEGFENMCLSLIGQGTTFCTSRRCKTSHQGGVLEVSPGDLYVAKTATSAFADPKSHFMFLTAELWLAWNSRSCSLEEWSRLFMLVNNADEEEGPTSSARLEAQETFATRAEAHRTPGKRKADHLETSWLNESPYKKLLSEEMGDEENPFAMESDEALEILKMLDAGLARTSLGMLSLSTDAKVNLKEHNESARSLEHNLEKLAREVGSKPQALSGDYNAPTVWGSIGAMGAKLDNAVDAAKRKTEVNVASEVAKVTDNLKDSLFETVADRAVALEARINALKSFVVRATKKLTEKVNDKVDRIDLELEGWDPSVPKTAPKLEATPAEAEKPEWCLDVMKSFENRLEEMETRVAQVTADTDEQAIRFAGLGFRSSREANAWLVLNMSEHHCGLVVDVHMVMEHIQASIAGQDSINRLEKMFKLKIKTLADGLAMTSFETKVPRYFSQTSVHKVVKNDASYFETIGNHDEWDSPISGFRARLKEELSTFRAAHQDNIDEALERDTMGYAVATMALTDSVSWLEGFIVFLDDYHRDLTKAKFGTKKAWHVTTRLGRRMLMELAVPRNGIQNSFQAGQNDQICQRIFWAVLKSQDIMARYRRHNYKDDPTVSSELVKFLAVNTGYDAIDVLTTDMVTLKADVATMKKDVLAAAKASHSAANKTDEMKKTFDLLVKRVGKLETHK